MTRAWRRTGAALCLLAVGALRLWPRSSPPEEAPYSEEELVEDPPAFSSQVRTSWEVPSLDFVRGRWQPLDEEGPALEFAQWRRGWVLRIHEEGRVTTCALSSQEEAGRYVGNCAGEVAEFTLRMSRLRHLRVESPLISSSVFQHE